MKSILILTLCAASLSAGIYALRQRELRFLETRTAEMTALRLRRTQDAQATGPASVDPVVISSLLRAPLAGDGGPEALQALVDRIETLSRADALRLIAAAADMPAPLPESAAAAVHAAAEVISETDPAAALEAVADLLPEDPRTGAVFDLCLRRCMKSDPGAAARFIREAIKTGKLKNHARGSEEELHILASLCEVTADPAGRLESIRGEPERLRDSLLKQGAQSLKSAGDTRAFAAAILTWPSGTLNHRVLETVAGKMMELEPGGYSAGADWIESLPGAAPGRKSEILIALLLREPSSEETASRAERILSQCPPEERTAAAAMLAGDWAAENHDAAGGWLNANRSAPWYDAAARRFAETVSQKDPATAFDWSLTISDESGRREAVRAVLSRWRRDNPEAVLEYVKASALPAEWKEEFSGGGGKETETPAPESASEGP